jgi:hypothetical protein
LNNQTVCAQLRQNSLVEDFIMKNWLIGIIIVVLGLVAWYLYSVSQAPVEEAPAPAPIVAEPMEPPQPVEEPVVPEDTLAPPPEAAVEETPLPPLAESDPLATETLSGLVGEEPVRQLVVNEQVVSRLVATLDALSGRQVPGSIKAVEGPGGEFQATANDDPESVIVNAMGDPIPQFVMDPVNYQRYTPYVEMLEAADAAQIIAAYRNNRPLFEEAYRQLGYPDGDFDQRLRSLLDELLAAPEVTGPVRLIKPEAYYLFVDKDLESLSAGQKILIRMGPDNAARVKARLAQIRAAL